MNNDTSFDITQESNPVQTVVPTQEDNNMLRATEKITALYCRLFVEDTKDKKKNGKENPSNSIQHQQVMLIQYAKSNHFPNPTFFIDDGYSGAIYDRSGYQKMLSEIEAGNVGTVITKDLSRLGRNFTLTGLYINYTFPQYGVRYITVNDLFDTIDPNSTDNDIAGIKNWFNEFFTRDTSRKIRVGNKAKGERGECLTTNKKWLAQAKKHIGELDRLFIRSYEDNVSGKIDDERFAMVNKSCTQEQKDLKAEVKSLQQVIEEQERQAENLEQFIQKVKRNSGLM